MESRKILFSIILIALMILPPVMLLTPVKAQETVGPASEHLEYKEKTIEEVPAAIGQDIDVYLYHLRPSQAQQLAGNPNIKLYKAPAGLVDFILNPAPVYTTTLSGTLTKAQAAQQLGVPEAAITYIEHTEEGDTYVELGAHPDYGINPFAFKDVRFAVNYLIDRKFVADHVYNGYAIPMYTFLSPADPTYTVIADIVVKYGFEYNREKAEQMITQVLTAVGAEKSGGKWMYNGDPITINFIIRTEDERKELGDLLASELEALGFTVNRQYMTFGDAIYKVYFTDPADFEWHIYTEGWGKGGLDRWDLGTINQFGAPWYSWLPGWGEAEYWNYKNPQIDDLCQKIYFGQFGSKEEYEQLYRQATELIIKDAVRIWIATTWDVYATSSKVSGVTVDLGAGLRSIYNFRELKVEGSDTVRIGHRHVWTASSIWNPFGGFEDVYSVDIERATYDPMMWTHPFNGEPLPFRADYTVDTAGPEGTMEVPADAIKWDASNDKWVPVGAGVTAKSKVTFDMSKYIGAKWHHGIEITWADVLASWVTNYELAYDPEKSQLENSIAQTLAPWMDTVKGIRILPDEKKIEVYVDYWHFDPNYIASYASFGMVNPAELYYVQFYLAFNKKTYALSDTRSERDQIPQLSLIISEQVEDVKAAAQEILDSGEFPADWFTVEGTSYMTQSEWSQRLNALINWIDTYGNAWISNGPFYIEEFDVDNKHVKLTAFRDPTYPFKPGDWYFGEPILTQIVDVEAPTIVAPGEPMNITVEVSGLSPLHVEYILRNPVTGEILATGYGEPIDTTTFLIVVPGEITSKLQEFSAYELILLAFSDQVAMPSEYKTIVTFSTALSGLQQSMQELQQALQQTQQQIQQIQENTQQQLQQIQENLQSQLQQIQEALGESVAQSFSQISQSIQDLSNTLTSSIQQIGNTMTSQIQQLGNTMTTSIDNVGTKVDNVNKNVNTLNSKVGDLSSKVGDLSKKTDDLNGKLNTLTAIVGIVLVLQLATIGIFYMKKGGV